MFQHVGLFSLGFTPYILSEYLFSIWGKIQDKENYLVEVSVAFAKPIGKEPDITKKGGEKRFKKYHNNSGRYPKTGYQPDNAILKLYCCCKYSI